jgi:nucleoside-diphosphate-sugar epimerase
MIFGIDGYLGWPLALRMAARGHEVAGVDNFATRASVKEVGSASALPILEMKERIKAAKQTTGKEMRFYQGDVTERGFVYDLIRKEKPDAVVHFAEQRSAPYSMIDADHASYTMRNNILSTINLIYAVKELSPNTHILKMGTMGEFGTPKFDIPEAAFVPVSIKGKEDLITTPKWAGSWYHWTKVHDTNNLLFANKIWGLRTTDIMQGPVYGTRTKEITDAKLFTRFDFDEVWGTVVNRYCVEAVLGMPLTPYGKGGQVRGFLSLEDSMEALTLLLENEPPEREYRAVNQFMELLSVKAIAEMVQAEAKRQGLDVAIKHVDNPRVEAEQHYYNPERRILPSLGFHLKIKMKDVVGTMIEDLKPYRGELKQYERVIMPKTKWK